MAADAKDSAKDVAGTAGEQVKNVASEARTQARDLMDQARGEARDQASSQQKRLASGLRSLGEELSTMADGSEQSGVATDLAGQASTRLDEASRWLESREPGEVLSEVSSFARRRPGTFLAAAAVVGFVGGRLTRSLSADGPDHGSAHEAQGAPSAMRAGGDEPALPPMTAGAAGAPAGTGPVGAGMPAGGGSSSAAPTAERTGGLAESDPLSGRPS